MGWWHGSTSESKLVATSSFVARLDGPFRRCVRSTEYLYMTKPCCLKCQSDVAQFYYLLNIVRTPQGVIKYDNSRPCHFCHTWSN
ncbi:hypothetical protein VFPPC_15188 [Pochonia chlamydosporia 170]|uniref:Uncharacterized protein n=1 Tax=Pochonia chlamydosporia 170 TaxID=1380566 RepID=A0A179G4E7_METCM|nr:hypothetical protein VFPPC_15188 [Pochonia chlamydosporia 170]OAQ72732.1 hypothetical protein VFPPC_15188 [Pochonia chlamydosporia 170]